MKQFWLFATSVVLCLFFVGCSVLPEEYPNGENHGMQASSSSQEKHDSLQEMVDDAIVGANEQEKLDELRIARYQVEVLTSRTPSDYEVEMAKSQIAQQKPMMEMTADSISFCRQQAEVALSEFVNDFSGEEYIENRDNRTFTTLYSGDGTGIVNGGIVPQKNGENIEYWRIADCTYYNQFFFAPKTVGADNMVKVVFRCNMYAYRLKDGLTSDVTELNNSNADIIEYKDSFIVVTFKNISELNLSFVNAKPVDLCEKILVYRDYDKAVEGFTMAPKGCEDLRVPLDCQERQLVDGFVGKPYVQMPDLVGHYIDISHPDRIEALDELGIKYKVVWEESKDDTVPSYCILSTSVAAGTTVDITDQTALLIEVTVAK